MIPSSVKFKGYRCFRDHWAGFYEFKAINVIVGRNNTGKSQLLDVVEMLVKNESTRLNAQLQFRARLSEQFLKLAFPENRSGGSLGAGYHWRDHGRHFVDSEIVWEATGSSVQLYQTADFIPAQRGQITVANARHNAIQEHLSSIKCHLSGRFFRRIAADRDIRAEKTATTLGLGPDGVGATHLIQRFLTNETFDADLIQDKLLSALNTIFGSDGNFSRIEIRQRGNIDASEDVALWEVFLREPSKGLNALSRSGSGLKTIILVLLNLLVMPVLDNQLASRYVFGFEELENNLHPALLRRLFRYLAEHVAENGCTLFLTTHSNVALDFFGMRTDSQIIQVSHDGESATTRTVMAHFDRVGLLAELGSRPSDLLQSNGVLWLEGPSDRIYFNRFIQLFSGGSLEEGRDYQCAYYGGSVLAKTEFSAPEDADEKLVNLLRLNNNIAVVCDGDRTAADGEGAQLKGRVQRIAQEVASIPKHFFWATESKEIENYIPGSVWSSVYEIPDIPDPGTFDKFPAGSLQDDCFVATHCRVRYFDKCKFAATAIPLLTVELLSHNSEFAAKLVDLVRTIREWNR